jgi:hypothetical protein
MLPSLPGSQENLEVTYRKWIQGHIKSRSVLFIRIVTEFIILPCRRITEYSQLQEVKIFCGTWNVNSRRVNEDFDDLSEWIIPNTCDIYAMTLQEIVQLNVTNVLLSSDSTEDAVNYWIKKFSGVLNEKCSSHQEGKYLLYSSFIPHSHIYKSKTLS